MHYTADGTEKAAAINTAGDILFDLPEGMEASRYQNGICVVGNVIYDKSGAVIASPEQSGYDALMSDNCGGYVLAKKVTSVTLPAPDPANTTAGNATTATAAAPTAEGDTTATQPSTDVPLTGSLQLSVGVMNNKGE